MNLTKIKTPFGLLSEKKQKALRALPSGAVQFYTGHTWRTADVPCWNNSTVYRQDPNWLPPEPAPQPFTVHWEHVPDWVEWVAADPDGAVYGYGSPIQVGLMWTSVTHLPYEAYTRGATPWHETLTRRPAK